jgi:hypothetical protein
MRIRPDPNPDPDSQHCHKRRLVARERDFKLSLFGSMCVSADEAVWRAGLVCWRGVCLYICVTV